MRFGEDIPDRILNKPILHDGLVIYIQAFFDLDSERNHGMGLSRIPWSCIANYAQFYDFDKEQTEDLLYFIKQMDAAHLKRLDEKKGK